MIILPGLFLVKMIRGCAAGIISQSRFTRGGLVSMQAGRFIPASLYLPGHWRAVKLSTDYLQDGLAGVEPNFR